jgi:hypothetical protein
MDAPGQRNGDPLQHMTFKASTHLLLVPNQIRWCHGWIPPGHLHFQLQFSPSQASATAISCPVCRSSSDSSGRMRPAPPWLRHGRSMHRRMAAGHRPKEEEVSERANHGLQPRSRRPWSTPRSPSPTTTGRLGRTPKLGDL